VYTRQAEAWRGRSDLPEPFCLVVSLVNPHDVLGYASSYREGGYDASEFRGTGVELPPPIGESLSSKPTVQTLMQMGMTAYLGPLGRAAPEYEMYDLERDPLERLNLLDHRTGEPRQASNRADRNRLAEALRTQMAELGTDHLTPS
jgi:hypothetical protein